MVRAAWSFLQVAELALYEGSTHLLEERKGKKRISYLSCCHIVKHKPAKVPVVITCGKSDH